MNNILPVPLEDSSSAVDRSHICNTNQSINKNLQMYAIKNGYKKSVTGFSFTTTLMSVLAIVQRNCILWSGVRMGMF